MHRLMLIPLFLTIIFLPPAAVCEETGTTDSSTYQWMNDNDTVSFTDDPMKIPARKEGEQRFVSIGMDATENFSLSSSHTAARKFV